MLDAYIIDRIRKEREAERQRSSQVPLRIETPRHERAYPESPEPETPERGSAVIDFQL